MAERTSPVGITPCLSPSMGSENRLKASRISLSSCAVTLCSLASLESRGLGASAGAFLFGGCPRRHTLAFLVPSGRVFGSAYHCSAS